MAAHNDFGTQGEDIAIQYLRTKGYDILDKNWRSGHKEIGESPCQRLLWKT